MKRTRIRRGKNRENRMGMLMAFIVVMLLMATVSFRSAQLSEKAGMYAEREAELTREIEKEKARSEEIAAYEKYMKTRKFIEETARQKLGLVYEDEIVFKGD